MSLSITGMFSQTALDHIIDLSYQDKPLIFILKDLEQRYDLRFSYGALPLQRSVSYSFRGNLDEVLPLFFAANNFLFKKIGNHIVLKEDTPFGQPLRGIVIDQDSRMPLIGANVIVVGTSPLVGSSTDTEGVFMLQGLKVGRYDLYIEYLGYEPSKVNQVLVTAGKDLFITVALRESTVEMDEIVVVAKMDRSKPLNDMATNSARSFSVEETQRYAAAISDPARMALSFAGVTGNGDDLTNEIVIRGNSSKGLLWRMEGVEIPNPNHFADLGSSGGSISMLSASTLSNSDFYTGAFPAEFGNALSGVFDLKLRNGNDEKREHSLQVGTLGLEASSEGYFFKKSAGSYLINYRYSTIDLIHNLLPALTEKVNPFQDLTYKLRLPTKKVGTFTLFGLGGRNSTLEKISRDTVEKLGDWRQQEFTESQQMIVVGLKHQLVLSDRSYLHTTLTRSRWKYADQTIRFGLDRNTSSNVIDITKINHKETTLSMLFNNKSSARSTFRTGFNIRHKSYDYNYKSFADTMALISFLDNAGSTQFLDAYMQWKHRFMSTWELNMGINVSTLRLNGSWGIDPRVGVKYLLRENESVSLSAGLYSKPDHLSTYFIERRQIDGTIVSPNLDLPMLKAFHLVAGYDLNIKSDLRLKLEAYYQSLFDIPVGTNSNTIFSVLNASTLFGIIFLNDMDGTQLVSQGKGKNYGVELTLEKFFSRGYYYLLTASIFDSKFTTRDQRQFPTRYATNRVFNILGGKEWPIGIRRKDATGVNGKFTYIGGLRDTPILLQESILAGHGVFDNSRYNTFHNSAYFRWDLGLFYRINARKATHTFSLDVQNVTNRRNVAQKYYEPSLEKILTQNQNGIIPFVNYRINFFFN